MSASLNSIPEPPRRDTIAARCRHFGQCGGCQLQDISYEEQLRQKRESVQRLLGPLGVDIGEAYASPRTWHYRNKMEYSFGDVYPPVDGGPTLKLGLKPQRKWYEILDLRECFLLSPEAPALLEAVRRWAAANSLAPYNSKRRTGLLRHLVVREGKNTGERMVALVTAPGEIPRQSFVASVQAAYPATSVVWGVNGKASDTAISDRSGTLFGAGFIGELLRLPDTELRYRISPHSFFQTNTHGAEVLYRLLRTWVSELAPQGVALDLYCGGGGIALALARVCRKVYGADANAYAASDADANAKLNGFSNAQFFTGSVETLLPSLLALSCDLAVVDPPRAGLHPAAIGPLLESGPRALLYVSCNPESLARDLGPLSARYKARRAVVVDLFPHTRHVETVVELSRLKL